MLRTVSRHGASVLITLTLAACSSPATLSTLAVDSVSPVGPDGTFTVTGAGFFRFGAGAGMSAELCGVRLEAAVVDPRPVRMLLPPSGSVSVEVGEVLKVTLTEDVVPGVSALRLVRPDGVDASVADAVDCPRGGRAAFAVLHAEADHGVEPLTLTFSAERSSGNAPLSYAWGLGDGSTASGAVVTHEFTAPGVYTVTLTVTDADGDTDTAMATVRVRENNAPTAHVDLTVRHGTDTFDPALVTLSGAGSSDPDGDALSYAWYVDGALVATTATFGHRFEYEPVDLHRYHVRLVVTDEYGLSAEDEFLLYLDDAESFPTWGGADVLDVTVVTMRTEGDRVTVSYTMEQPFEQAPPGSAFCFDGQAPDVEGLVLLGFLMLDVDGDVGTGQDVLFPGYGFEYVVFLGTRDADGRYPVIELSTELLSSGCTPETVRTVGFATAEQVGNTIKFSFEGLPGTVPTAFRAYTVVVGGTELEADTVFF